MSLSEAELSTPDSFSPARHKPRRLTAIRLARLTALVAVAIGGYLLWASLAASGHVAGCGDDAGPGCSSVLLSRWSSWIGLPVGLPAVVTYLCLFGLLFCIGPGAPPRTRRCAWGTLVPLATLLVGAAAWFIGLQLFVLKSVCLYCMALHACGLALAMFVFWYAPIHWRPAVDAVAHPVALTFRGGVVLILVGFIGIGALIGGQVAIEPPARKIEITATPALEIPKSGVRPGTAAGCAGATGASAAPTNSSQSVAANVPLPAPPADDPWARPGPHRRLVLAGGKATVDAEEVPILGDPNAEIVVAELFDYTCPECRIMHDRMREARQRYGDRLALAMLPTPINASCNKYVRVTVTPHGLACEYARMALAVWNVRPAAFAEYHNWLMDPPEVPTLSDARKRASELLGREAFEAALGSERLDRQIEDDTRIYHRAGEGVVPKLLTKGFILVGLPSSTDKLCGYLEKYSGLGK